MMHTPRAFRDTERPFALVAGAAALLILTASAPAAAQVPPEPAPALAGQQPPAPVLVRLPVFFHVLAGLWVPAPGAFAENHRAGGALDLMGGLSIEELIHQRIDLFGDLTLSRQGLQERAFVGAQTETFVAALTLGARWTLWPRSPSGEPYLLGGVGFVYESGEGNAFHSPPQPSWISMVGVGWEVALGPVLRLGARVTATYLNEGGAHLGWVAPSLALGGQI